MQQIQDHILVNWIIHWWILQQAPLKFWDSLEFIFQAIIELFFIMFVLQLHCIGLQLHWIVLGALNCIVLELHWSGFALQWIGFNFKCFTLHWIALRFIQLICNFTELLICFVELYCYFIELHYCSIISNCSWHWIVFATSTKSGSG